MLADTVDASRLAWADRSMPGSGSCAAFLPPNMLLRLIAAPGNPGAAQRGPWRARLDWAASVGGICDLVGCCPPSSRSSSARRFASLFGFVWVFKLVRYAPGLASLGSVIGDARQALLSVLLGFCIVLLFSATFAYLLERSAQPDVFGSIPAALWWAIVTLTTTGYGDVVPETLARRCWAALS